MHFRRSARMGPSLKGWLLLGASTLAVTLGAVGLAAWIVPEEPPPYVPGVSEPPANHVQVSGDRPGELAFGDAPLLLIPDVGGTLVDWHLESESGRLIVVGDIPDGSSEVENLDVSGIYDGLNIFTDPGDCEMRLSPDGSGQRADLDCPDISDVHDTVALTFEGTFQIGGDDSPDDNTLTISGDREAVMVFPPTPILLILDEGGPAVISWDAEASSGDLIRIEGTVPGFTGVIEPGSPLPVENLTVLVTFQDISVSTEVGECDMVLDGLVANLSCPDVQGVAVPITLDLRGTFQFIPVVPEA